jgi:small subunit ribosomal protein S8
MITDPIADLLTRIRNGYMARLLTISAPYSKIKEDILKILKRNKYIVSYEIENITEVKKNLIINLNNVRLTKVIPTFKRISKP